MKRVERQKVEVLIRQFEAQLVAEAEADEEKFKSQLKLDLESKLKGLETEKGSAIDEIDGL